MDDRELLESAREAAGAGAEVHRALADFRQSEWGEKGRADFVTEVDLEAERRIIRVLRERFPDHQLLAEEGTDGEDLPAAGSAVRRAGGATSSAETAQAAGEGSRAPIRWIIDPLDGTTNWLHGYPEYAVSVAAEDDVGLRVAVVLNSATGELFEAARGSGSRRDGERIRTSGVASLRLALVGTGFPFKKLELLPPYLETFARVLRETSGIRRGGAAALDLCDLACGRLDAFWEYWLMPWDVAAGALIVREAGGIFEPLAAPEPEPRRASSRAGSGASAARPPGRGSGELRSGGFIAANAHLMDAFRALVTRGEG